MLNVHNCFQLAKGLSRFLFSKVKRLKKNKKNNTPQTKRERFSSEISPPTDVARFDSDPVSYVG